MPMYSNYRSGPANYGGPPQDQPKTYDWYHAAKAIVADGKVGDTVWESAL